jgi:hypothetical protein
MKPPQLVRLVPGEGKGPGEITIALPMDVQAFARFISPLGKAGWVFPIRRDDVPPELADVPESLIEIAKLALDGVNTDSENHKQWYLGEILERCGVQFPEQLERGVPG